MVMSVSNSLAVNQPTVFSGQANETAASYEIAAQDPIAWWAQQSKRLDWDTPWHTALEWQPAAPTQAQEWSGQLTVPSAQWFTGGTLNAAVRSEEHTSELQSRGQLGCRPRLEEKKRDNTQ